MIDYPEILYHGSDARIIRMSDEERASFKKDCFIAIDYLWEFYKPLYETFQEKLIVGHPGIPSGAYTTERIIESDEYKEKLGTKLHGCLNEKLMMLWGMKHGAENYQYSSLYLTTEEITARNYAYNSFAFGENGLLAYRLIEGLRILQFNGWSPTPEVSSAIQRIENFALDKEKFEPVIIPIKEYNPKYLLFENNTAVIDLGWNRSSNHSNFRYTQPLHLDLSSAIFLKKNE